MTVSLDEDTPVIRRAHTQQGFYFANNADLMLHLLDNKDKTSRKPYAYNNSLDKKQPTFSHKTIEQPSKHADHPSTRDFKDFNTNENTQYTQYAQDTQDTQEDDESQDQANSLESHDTNDTERAEKEFGITDVDELYDKLFELYDEYKRLKNEYSAKYGVGFYIKNEHSILEKIIKKNVDTKLNLLKKFENLSLIYKDKHITFNKHEPLTRLKKQYDTEIERIYGMSQVESYKEYIKYAFLAIELIAGAVGFDMTGYTAFQTERIDKYEKILVEIGAIPTLTRLNTINPLLKLILLFGFNTICFIGLRVAIQKDKTGGMIFSSIASVIGNVLTPPSAKSAQPFNTQPSAQAKMKGPSVVVQ